MKSWKKKRREKSSNEKWMRARFAWNVFDEKHNFLMPSLRRRLSETGGEEWENSNRSHVNSIYDEWDSYQINNAMQFDEKKSTGSHVDRFPFTFP